MRGENSKSAILSQGKDFYPGVDDWHDCLIEPGKTIIQFDWRDEDIIKNQVKTVSTFFTDEKSLEGCLEPDGKVNASNFGENVQVFPRTVDPLNGSLQYPDKISVYRVLKPIPGAESVVRNNPLLGDGGTWQFYSKLSERDLLKEGYIKLEEIKSTNKVHKLDFLLHQEMQQKNIQEIRVSISQKHNELVNKWLKGTQEQREKAMNIIGMEREYERLKAEKEKGLGKSGSEIQQEPIVRSSEMEQNLSAQNLEKGVDASPMEVSAEKSGIEMEISGGSPSLEIGGEDSVPDMEKEHDIDMELR